VQPADRLSIGSKICRELVGKLLSDMANMREESIITSTPEGEGELEGIKWVQVVAKILER
jgi:hypothetical protein